MNIRLVSYYILILILLFLLAIVIYYYKLLRRKVLINKRLLKYSIYKESHDSKLFDNIFNSYDKLVSKISKKLYKSKFLTKYSLKYRKYINKENKDYLDKMDFISKKLIISFLFILIVLVFDIFKNESFTFIQLIFSFVLE